MTGNQFEKVLDLAEENVQLKRSLNDVLSLLDTYANIEILLPKQDRDKLERARKISKNKS